MATALMLIRFLYIWFCLDVAIVACFSILRTIKKDFERGTRSTALTTSQKEH